MTNLAIAPGTMRLWRAFSDLDVSARRHALARGQVIAVGGKPTTVPEGQLVVAISGRIAVQSPGGIKNIEIIQAGELLITSRATDLLGLVQSEALVVDPNEWSRAGGDAGKVFLENGLRRRCARLERLVTCASSHSVAERLADILVLMEPLSSTGNVSLDQALMAGLLAVQRTTLSAAATSFARSGITRTGRGSVRVLDLERLKAASCGCRAFANPQRMTANVTVDPFWLNSITHP
jgi:hypothetical protein